MAITNDLSESSYGIAFKDVYFRIVMIAITRNLTEQLRFSAMIDVAGYATKPQEENTREIEFRRYHASLPELDAQNGDTFLAKCYSWIMSQPNMAGSQSI